MTINLDFGELLNLDIHPIIVSYQSLFLSRLQYYLPDKVNKPLLPDDLLKAYYLTEVGEILADFNINNIVLTKRHDIVTLFNLILSEISKKLMDKIKVINKSQMLFALYSLVSYFAEFHGRITFLLNKTMDITEFKNIPVSEMKVLELIYENIRENIMIDSLKAEDKATIQYLLNLVLYTEQVNNYEIDLKGFFEIYLLAGVLVRLIAERELVTSNTLKQTRIEIQDLTLSFPEEYMIVVNNYFKTFLEDSIIDDEEILTEEVITKLERNFIRGCGFSLQTIENMLDNSGQTIKDNFLCTVLDKSSLLNMIINDGNCGEVEANNILNYMLNTKPTEADFLYQSFDRHEKRIFQTPLLQVELIPNVETFLFSYPLLIQSYRLLKRKIVYNLIPECHAFNSKIIEKKIKNGLVKNIEKLIEPYVNVVKINVQKFEIINENQKIVVCLDREIDLLAVMDKTLMLIECKDVYYSFSTVDCRQDINNSIKYINNILLKVEEIKRKEMEIAFYLQCNFDTICPVLVYKNYNISIDSLIDKKGVNITTYGKLIDFITKCLCKG